MNDICSYKFLLIDDTHLIETKNLKRKVNQAVKHPEPVIRLDAPWDTDEDFFNHMNVLFDPQERIFKMWYSTIRYFGQDEDGPRKLAYATSTDGIHWEKPELGIVEVNGSKANNYLLPEMGTFYGVTIIDPSDIAARRCKMIFTAEAAWTKGVETNWSRYHVPLCLAYSHDGIRWERPQHINPILRGVSDAGFSFYYDPDRRKYVLLTRRVPNLPRDISQYESYDLVNWEDKGRVLVPGDAEDPPDMYNFQSVSPFRYEDSYLGMLAAHYTLPHCESYEGYNKPPPGFPNKRLGMIELQLAYSHDGKTWSRPKDRSPVVPAGERGSRDAMIFPANNPIVIDGETWIYYTGCSWRHSFWDQREQYERDKGVTRTQSCGMLARMPEDHWTSLDAGSEEGCFVSKPWPLPYEVFVNADVLSGGSIEVELVTPYGEPMKGFHRDVCIPVTASGKHQQIKWKNDRHPWDFASEHRGGVSARFYLRNAKLYSYTFTLPDSDGQLARDRANARWWETIKHRSDNWGRLSTEPPQKH